MQRVQVDENKAKSTGFSRLIASTVIVFARLSSYRVLSIHRPLKKAREETFGSNKEVLAETKGLFCCQRQIVLKVRYRNVR